MDLLLPSKQLLSAFSIALMLSARYNSTDKYRAIASLKIDVARSLSCSNGAAMLAMLSIYK
ncbi:MULTISPECIES: hypothetical protein [unclassified Nostoc]|uniref:hypothetical protein n=1 Tax=unclassified Nostoc TaxID=2593658 RepID=UPI002AD34453|nr:MULTISPECIES: hypothetical protein [unclassified Nostoc]MDZ8122506.1 hypothetical protein [Nostoc sp. CmiVER01]MDZ8221679.1 hypothetical protein [Nostoc sp. ChiVER01]